jgi:hypothetical protein
MHILFLRPISSNVSRASRAKTQVSLPRKMPAAVLQKQAGLLRSKRHHQSRKRQPRLHCLCVGGMDKSMLRTARLSGKTQENAVCVICAETMMGAFRLQAIYTNLARKVKMLAWVDFCPCRMGSGCTLLVHCGALKYGKDPTLA